MNAAQIAGILRAIVPGIVAYMVGRGWVSADSAGEVVAAVVTIGAAIWSGFVHTDGAKIAAVTALPDVAKIVPVANPDPASAVAIAAKDHDQPKVG